MTWPMPLLVDGNNGHYLILSHGAEPLSPEVIDARSIWQSTSGVRKHIERIEQYGNRVVITTSGVIA